MCIPSLPEIGDQRLGHYAARIVVATLRYPAFAVHGVGLTSRVDLAVGPTGVSGNSYGLACLLGVLTILILIASPLVSEHAVGNAPDLRATLRIVPMPCGFLHV